MVQPTTTPDHEAEIAKVDELLPDLFMRSLAGSYREGAVRCLIDLAETYPDRPAGVYDVARGVMSVPFRGPEKNKGS